MTLHLQGQLLEPAPARAVMVPAAIAARPCWWGLDTSTSRYTLGFVEQREDGELRRGAHSVRLPDKQPNEGKRWAGAKHQLELLIRAMISEGDVPAPGVVYVEQASGQSPNPPMLYVIGVALATLYDELGLLGYQPRIETVTSSHWKLVVAGNGSIAKPKFGKGVKWEDVREDYGILQWARMMGYTGDGRDCWDDADGMAQAECARREVAIRGG